MPKYTVCMSVWIEGVEAEDEDDAINIALFDLNNFSEDRKYFKVSGEIETTLEIGRPE